MKFLVCKKQDAEGCDYSIGCGMHYGIVDAENIEQAIIDVVYPDGRDELSSLEGEQALAEIIIVPAELTTKVDIEKLKADLGFARAMASVLASLAERVGLESSQVKCNGKS